MQIFSTSTGEVKKSFSRFKDVVYTGTFRHDGKLIASGDATGKVQILDSATKTVLRTLNAHKSAIRSCKFGLNSTQLLSGSDDFQCKLWDIPTESQVRTFEGHIDYVRTVFSSLTNANLFLTGSYDHTLKLWDARQEEFVSSFNHGHPIEAVLMFPEDSLVVSAGSNVMKIWDVLSGRLLCSAENHQKTITALSFDSTQTKILSSSLDHMIKVFDTVDYKVTHSIKFTSPILSFDLSKDDSVLCTGMNNGFISIRKREVKVSEGIELEEVVLKRGTKKYFERGKNSQPDSSDFLVKSEKQNDLSLFDKYLRKFQYRLALDAVLAKCNRPEVVCPLLVELSRRGGLDIALSGRSEESLHPICNFIIKHFSNPSYSKILLDVCSRILDIYASLFGQSIAIDELLVKLQSRVKGEVQFQKSLFSLLGTVDLVMNSSNKE